MFKTYLEYIICNPSMRSSCTDLAQALTSDGQKASHDKLTQWLCQSNYSTRELWNQVSRNVDLHKGILVLDDTKIEKPHSQIDKNPLMQYVWGQDGPSKGINLVTLVWHHQGQSVIVDYHLMNPNEPLTKNEVLRMMVKRAFKRGFGQIVWLFDSWYSGKENLACLRKHGYDWITVLKKNCKVVINNTITKVGLLHVKNGMKALLPKYGIVSIFVTDENYVLCTSLIGKRRRTIKRLYHLRWQIEESYRSLKQNYHLAACQARRANAWQTHVHVCLRAYNHHVLTSINPYKHQTQIRHEVIKKHIIA